MPTAHDAKHLAALGREWIAAWNSRDLERVLKLYAENAEMTSDKIQAFGFDSIIWRIRSSLRAKRSNPSHRAKEEWIASSLCSSQ